MPAFLSKACFGSVAYRLEEFKGIIELTNDTTTVKCSHCFSHLSVTCDLFTSLLDSSRAFFQARLVVEQVPPRLL